MANLIVPLALLLLSMAGCGGSIGERLAPGVSVVQVTQNLYRVHDQDHRATCYVLVAGNDSKMSCVTHVNVEVVASPSSGLLTPPKGPGLPMPPLVPPPGTLPPGMQQGARKPSLNWN